MLPVFVGDVIAGDFATNKPTKGWLFLAKKKIVSKMCYRKNYLNNHGLGPVCLHGAIFVTFHYSLPCFLCFPFSKFYPKEINNFFAEVAFVAVFFKTKK